MKKLATLGILIILLLTIGCAMERHKSYIRKGLFVTGLNRNAFLSVWGMPDRTYVISSNEFESGSWGVGGGHYSYRGGGSHFRGKVPLDVWVYEKKETELIFNGIVLTGWITNKTREELATE